MLTKKRMSGHPSLPKFRTFKEMFFEWFMLLCQHTFNYNKIVFWFMMITIDKQSEFRQILFISKTLSFSAITIIFYQWTPKPPKMSYTDRYYFNVSWPNLSHLSNKPCSIQWSDMDQHESVKSCQMPVINDRHLTTVFSMIHARLLYIFQWLAGLGVRSKDISILKCRVFVQ